jgi:hypothetical protein
LPLLIIAVVFNGYLNPNQFRVFGDMYPHQLTNSSQNFEFFRTDFQEEITPGYFAPFRYQLDFIASKFSSQLNVIQIQWITIFLPFLLSVYLSYFLFYRVAKGSYLGILLWSFYTFSTFVLFTSSIHTDIITGINFFLFWIYLLYVYLDSNKTILNTIFYILCSAVIITIACIFEMRMVIVTVPFFVFLIAEPICSQIKNKIELQNILVIHFAIGALILVNFAFIFLNISQILGQISQSTSRSLWGNEYFSLINTLAISHPFWNNSQPNNFIL